MNNKYILIVELEFQHILQNISNTLNRRCT